MANTVIGASVEIEFQSVGNMRKALKEANSELLAMQDQFGAASQQAIAAAKKVADLKDRIQDAKETADLFDPGKKFQAFVTLGAQMAAGFSAVQGAMALVGTESENVEKALLKVQSAMALAQGLSELKDFGKSWQQLKIFIGGATQGMSQFKKALISSGIGLLVVAVGTLVAYWDEVKALVSGVTVEQKKLNEEIKKSVEQEDKKLSRLERQTETLKAQGLSEKEILRLKIEQVKKVIDRREQELKANKETRDAQIAQSKRYNEIIKQVARVAMEINTAVLRAIAIPLQVVISTVNAAAETLGFGKVTTLSLQDEITKLNKGASEYIANLAFDPKKTEKDIDENIEKIEDSLIDAREKYAKYNSELVDINQKKNEKIDKQNQESLQKALELEKQIQDELAKSRLTAREKELFEIEKTYQEQKKILEAAGRSTVQLTELYNQQRADINKKYDEINRKAAEDYQNKVKELVLRKQGEQVLSEQEQARQAVVDKYAKEREELEKQYPNNLQLQILLKQNEQAELKKVDDKFKEENDKKRIEKLEKELADESTTFERRRNILNEEALLFKAQLDGKVITEEEYNEKVKSLSDARIKINEQEIESKIRMADETAKILNGLANILGTQTKAGKAAAIAAIVVEQAASISRIISNTAAANAKAVAASPLTGGMPWVAINTASAAVSIASSIANARKSIQQINSNSKNATTGGAPPPSSTGGGAAAPMQPQLSPAVQGQALNAEAINALGNTAIRAYVTNSDLQNNQQRNAYLERNARIG